MTMTNFIRCHLIALLMVLGHTVSAFAADDDGMQPSIWLSYAPASGEAFSFWYTGQNGVIADWTLPAGYALGETRYPPLEERGEHDLPIFVFSAGSQILQEIKVAKGAAAVPHTTFSLQLTYGHCPANTCTLQTTEAEVSESVETSPETAAEYLTKRRSGTSIRADQTMINIAMHKAYNKDGHVERAFFLPFNAELIAAPAPLRLETFKDIGFFSTFPLKTAVDGDAYIQGLMVLDKPKADGLEVYVVGSKNDFGRAGDMPAEMPAMNGASVGNGGGLLGPSPLSFLVAIGLALVGGLILNAMPCVLPVLALKVFSALKSGGGENESAIRRDATAYTLGVVVSFAALAGVLIAIRAAGVSAGWGYQLQSPMFVLVMALVFFAIGLNFMGVYEVRGVLTGAGQGLTQKKGGVGAFFTGVLATVVAAPCTAPFMVTAVAYALAQSPAKALTIFISLGVGLSLPYLIIGFVPASRRWFPKPGAWMVTFRTFLAFPMFAAVVWMVWILSIQSGPTGTLLALSVMLLIAFALWMAKVTSGMLRVLAVGLSVVAGFYALTTIKPQEKPHQMEEVAGTTSVGKDMIGTMPVIPFSHDRLMVLRAEGKGVFIHHWAAWCMICLVHENLVFSTAEFQDYLRRNNIVFMLADRTNDDPELLKYMEANYGRSSQPLDVFFAPGLTSDVQVLPTVFTTGKVIGLMTEAIQNQNK